MRANKYIAYQKGYDSNAVILVISILIPNCPYVVLCNIRNEDYYLQVFVFFTSFSHIPAHVIINVLNWTG